MKRRFRQPAWLIAAMAAGALGAQAQPPPGGTLPVQRVTLFSSGVAYTERGGEVEGDAAVDLMFHTAQINDILKSMVLIDSSGSVRPATFATKDPVRRSLQAFAVDVSDNVTMVSLLGKLRGTRVQVSSAGKMVAEGAIAGVEKRRSAAALPDAPVIETTYLTLLTDSGVTDLPLEGDRTVRILDERLNTEFRDALALLASSTDDQKRQVRLHFSGAGKRQVRVGYVMESPVWKISYRLILGGDATAAEGKPYLQGWAMVENTTDEDWKGVKLSLISGRPVSFVQDLYQPLYINRPVVGPDIAYAPPPTTHDSDLNADNAKVAGTERDKADAEDRTRALVEQKPASGEFARKRLAGRVAKEPESLDSLQRQQVAHGQASVVAQASGQKTGEMFAYNIKTPVTLPRQQAALIPVVAQPIALDRLSLYNADVDDKFPLNAVRLRNNTGLHLKGGPLTLFDGGTYAGDARMEDIPPGDSRIVTYAVDLSMICSRAEPVENSNEVHISARKGVITWQHREVSETVYTLKSRGDKPRTVLVEHPYEDGMVLKAPAKATEKTADLFRFAVPVPAGKTVALKVVTVKPVSEEVAILDGDNNTLYEYIKTGSLSLKLKTALQGVIARRGKINDLKAALQNRQNDIKSMGEDQDRIRKNMGALDKSSTLYKRYVSELDSQETRLGALRADVERLRMRLNSAQNELQDFATKISD